MKKFTIERASGNIAFVENNLLIEDLEDMQEVEEWEHRLEIQLKVPYILAFREKEGKILYSIFTDLRGKGSVFK